MAELYSQRAATLDHGPARLTLRVTQGDDLFERVRLVSRHTDPLGTPGAVTRIPIPVQATVFDSAIYVKNTGLIVSQFDIEDDLDHANVVLLKLTAATTSNFTPGTYWYWLRALDADTGREATLLQGPLEIVERPT